MGLSNYFTLAFLGFYTLGSCASSSLPRIIYKDVAILGGGASGSHAAVRLREDFNKSVIVIENQENLVCISSPLSSPV